MIISGRIPYISEGWIFCPSLPVLKCLYDGGEGRVCFEDHCYVPILCVLRRLLPRTLSISIACGYGSFEKMVEKKYWNFKQYLFKNTLNLKSYMFAIFFLSFYDSFVRIQFSLVYFFSTISM